MFEMDARGDIESLDLPFMASAAAPLAGGGGVLLATEKGIFQAAAKSRPRPLAPIALGEGFRSNDGKVGPDGALWWSSMDDAGGARPGRVFRYDGRENRTVLDGIHIANAMAFSPDGGVFYLADSKRKTIWAFPHRDGDLGERRVFARFDDGEPDGAATDAEGFLWVAVWGGWRLDRFAPDGRLDRSIPMPVRQPSSVIFGGEDLSTLYVTSAREWLSPEDLQRQPLAGALFALEPGVRGSPVPPFGA